MLAMGEPLPDKNRDHDLSGDWAGHGQNIVHSLIHIITAWEAAF